MCPSNASESLFCCCKSSSACSRFSSLSRSSSFSLFNLASSWFKILVKSNDPTQSLHSSQDFSMLLQIFSFG
eukprot:UN21730